MEYRVRSTEYRQTGRAGDAEDDGRGWVREGWDGMLCLEPVRCCLFPKALIDMLNNRVNTEPSTLHNV